MNIVYLNGDFLPLEKAKVSVLDRGFLFADGVYEVITIYHGKLFHAKEHLTRLNQSLHAIQLPLKISEKQWLTIFDKLLKQNHIKEENKSLYLQITRGTEKKRSLGLPKTPIDPTIFIMLKDLDQKNYDNLKSGFKVITRDDIRWNYCHIKSIALLSNILMQQEAKQEHAEEVIFIHNGMAIEGSNSNLFIVKDGMIITPPKNNSILGGITRELVIEIALKHHIPLQERNISTEQLFSADEVWITSSSRDIMPITIIDDAIINQGKPGALWRKVVMYFQDYKQRCQNIKHSHMKKVFKQS